MIVNVLSVTVNPVTKIVLVMIVNVQSVKELIY